MFFTHLYFGKSQFLVVFFKVSFHDTDKTFVEIRQANFDDTRVLETSSPVFQHKVYARRTYEIFKIFWNFY